MRKNGKHRLTDEVRDCQNGGWRLACLHEKGRRKSRANCSGCNDFVGVFYRAAPKYFQE